MRPTAVTDRHAGRHLLVTGAGTGIGRAIAERLAAEGASLTLLARDAGRLQVTADAIGGAHVVSADVRDRGALHAAIAAAAEAQGPFHGAVANSGVGGPNAPEGEDRFDDLVATNLTGTYDTFRAIQAHLAPGPDTRQLVAVSSILARIGVPGYTGYCASKAGILGLVRALAAELAPEDIQVNAVCPGWVDTAMAHEGLDGMAVGMGVTKDEAHAIAMQAVPLGRMGQPDEVAGTISWLLSGDSRGATGQGFDVNGGAFMS
jgi:NAD(P)-dependent dehydrogenase (short-subunit alcohol dehydrogenase family)